MRARTLKSMAHGVGWLCNVDFRIGIQLFFVVEALRSGIFPCRINAHSHLGFRNFLLNDLHSADIDGVALRLRLIGFK